MAQKIEDPKTLAAKIAKTRAMSGGREVKVNATPSAGMPGSGKSRMLEEVKVVAQAPQKPTMNEKKYQVGQYVVVKGFGKVNVNEINKLIKQSPELKKFITPPSEPMNGASGIPTVRTYSGEQGDILLGLIKKNKIPKFDETMKTASEVIGK